MFYILKWTIKDCKYFPIVLLYKMSNFFRYIFYSSITLSLKRCKKCLSNAVLSGSLSLQNGQLFEV